MAILDGLSVLGEITLSTLETHSRRLFTSLEWLLKKTGQDWDSLDLLAIALGPGSFTGLRIGLATVKGIAMAHNVAICGVPSLDAMAAQVAATPGDTICPVMDARKHQIFTAVFRAAASSEQHEKISEYMVINPEELGKYLPDRKRAVIFGSGFDSYREEILSRVATSWSTMPPHLSFARASATGFLAASRIMAGGEPDNPALLAPVYVRASEAEMTRQARLASAASGQTA